MNNRGQARQMDSNLTGLVLLMVLLLGVIAGGLTLKQQIIDPLRSMDNMELTLVDQP